MIDSNNKLNSLSKSLIEATRRVMEKKTNKHGHDAVGHEDSDIDNDGDTDKSDSYLHNRRKAIKHSMKKEEVEEIDELKASTVDSYREKAYAQQPAGDDNSQLYKKRKTGRDMAFKKVTHGARVPATNEEVEEIDEGYTAASNRAEASRQRAIKNAAKAYKTHGNMDRAIKDHDLFAKDAAKIKAHLGEEIELDEAMNANDRFKHHHETAKSLLKSITNHLNTEHASAMKAKDHRGNKGPNWSHVSSMEHVANQLGQIHDMLARKGEYSMHESVDLDEAPVAGVAPGSMADDGHLCATKVFHKEWAEGTPIFSQHAEPDANGDIAWYDVMFEHGIEKMVPTDEMEILMAESHERHGKRKMKEDLDESAKIAAHLIKRYGDNVRKSHVRSAADDFGVGYVALSHAVRKKLGVNRLEEEQIDELTKDTVLKYLAANKKSDAAAQEKGDYSKSVKRMRGTDVAVRKYTAKPGSKYVRVPATEEVEHIDELSRDTLRSYRMKSKSIGDNEKGDIYYRAKGRELAGRKAYGGRMAGIEKAKVMAKEEVEIDEARGRPRKNPLPANQQSTAPEPRQHIIQQLQRAKLSMQGSGKVTFKDGSTHDIHGAHASKALDKYAGMKPAEKEAFQKKIGASHAAFKAEL